MVITAGVVPQGGFAFSRPGSGVPPREESRSTSRVTSTWEATWASPEIPQGLPKPGGTRPAEER